jgi:hypothetical protein
MIITNLLTIHNQLKIYHWQTKSYAEHKAFGRVYDKFTDLIDSFIEVFMGKYGTIKNNGGFKISLDEYASGSITSKLDEYIKYLTNDLVKSMSEEDTDLLNIRDEMLSELNTLKYLLTLK